MQKVSLKVNGRQYQFVVEPDKVLLDLLRKDLHLTGAKQSCDRNPALQRSSNLRVPMSSQLRGLALLIILISFRRHLFFRGQSSADSVLPE